MRQRVNSQAPNTGCAVFCDLQLRYIRVRYGFCCSMLLCEYIYLFSGGWSTRHTLSDTDPVLAPCAVPLLLPLLRCYIHLLLIPSAVLLLILMLPLLRVQHHQSYGYRLFFPLKTLVGVRLVVISQALLGYVIYEYSMDFSHADRVLVIGDADCEPSIIQPKAYYYRRTRK